MTHRHYFVDTLLAIIIAISPCNWQTLSLIATRYIHTYIDEARVLILAAKSARNTHGD